MTMYSTAEKYLDTANPYTSANISIADATASITLNKNIASGMTDFTAQCKYLTCIPPMPQFLTKPSDKIIRLNIPMVLLLEVFHSKGYPITTSYIITNGGQDIVTSTNYMF